MDPPRVSVVLTTYNRAELLAAALNAIRRQLFSGWELLICDDGSTDDSPQVIRQAQDNMPLRWLQLPHTGKLERLRNAGLAAAQGEYIAFLDDDDTWLPHYLARMVGRLDQQPDLGLVYSDLRFRFPDGRLSPPVLSTREKDGRKLRTLLASGLALYPSILVFRHRLLDKIGLVNEDPVSGGELAFLLRLAWAAPAGCVPEALVIIRRDPAGLSHRRNRQYFENALSATASFASRQRLNIGHRLLFRRTLARYHTHLALIYQKDDERALARHYLSRSIQLNPLQRRAWVALAGLARQ